jgi:biotin carboxyl carrier protein
VTFDLEAGGTTRHVESRGGQLWLDGRPVNVDAVKVGQAWSMLLDHRSYEVSVVERGPDELIVHVNGRTVTVRGGRQRFGDRPTRTTGARDGVAPHGAQRVVAPMPGRIARVLVKTGDSVAARQGLVVVEAMKMENELRAPRAGTVTAVRAVAGALVDANAVLIVIE